MDALISLLFLSASKTEFSGKNDTFQNEKRTYLNSHFLFFFQFFFKHNFTVLYLIDCPT